MIRKRWSQKERSRVMYRVGNFTLGGMSVAEACRRVSVPRATYNQWVRQAATIKEFGGGFRKENYDAVQAARVQAPTVKQSRSRRFVLDRHEDATGTSGTGIVAEGVEFSNGKVALHWFSHYGAVNVYDSMLVTTALHGHNGKTKVIYLDAELP